MSARASSSHMQIPLVHDSFLISPLVQWWRKNIQDDLLAARLPTSMCIKYLVFTSQPTVSPSYLYSSSRHHQ